VKRTLVRNRYRTQKKYFFFSAIGFILLMFLGIYWYAVNCAPLIPKDGAPVIYTFAKGKNSVSLANDLYQLKLINHPHLFVLCARLENKANHLQAGEYRFEAGITTARLFDKLNRGEVIHYSVTLVEGWTFAEVLTQLAKTEPLIHVITHQSPSLVIYSLGKDAPAMEGWFYPDTYYFVRGNTDIDILKKANVRMHEKLAKLWERRAPGLIYSSPEEALIVASLIEKETHYPSERPMVAAVILHRLQLNMPLQIDASVIYGLGAHYNEALTREDLAIDTAYNTYLHTKLPPTPIAMPSEASIYAALHPSPISYLYYVAKGDGQHYFSDTLAEHNQAVMRYQLKQKLSATNLNLK
jgi:UPF0755 protein